MEYCKRWIPDADASGTFVKRFPFESAILVIGLGILVMLGFAKQAAQSHRSPSVYSSYDTGPNGYRALYEVLLQEDVPIERAESELGLLQKTSADTIGMPVGTLVISSITPELTYDNTRNPQPLDDSDINSLRTFVRNGGHLVVVNAAFKQSTMYQAFHLRAVAAHTVRSWGDTAAEYLLGKGMILAIATPGVFSNRSLASAQNARFAYDMLAGHGAVAFYERIHGYVADKSFWDALPPPVHTAVWITLAIVALGLIGANIRFTPPVPLDTPDERDSSAYLTGMASLLRRAHAARSAIAAFTEDALRRARRRYGLPASAGIHAIADRAARTEIGKDFSELERLLEGAPANDAALVRAAALNARLRKELG
jgi:hypothetical protein